MAEELETAPAAEVQRNFSLWQDRALRKPVGISRNGRPRLVMMSVEEYQRLKRRDRQVLSLDDLADEDLAAIAKTKVPDEYAHLNKEVED
ncbi:MAG: type II toxin-antitoxin system Phd/YefM family antitoxin [Rhizomicrobium sp.]|jgi:PHD/YefM family antitoxin component YafN of YafNO toxin-antitoxin module